MYDGIKPMQEFRPFQDRDVYFGSSASVFRGVGAHVMSHPPSTQITPRPWQPDRQNATMAERINYLEQELLRFKSPLEQVVQAPPPAQLQAHSAQMSMTRYSDGSPHEPQVLHVSICHPPTSSKLDGGVVPMSQHEELMKCHKQLLDTMAKQQDAHIALMQAHADLMKSTKAQATCFNASFAGVLTTARANQKKLNKHPALGVVRLDYDYPPAEGDIDCPASYGYDAYFRVIPKMTFEMAKAGTFTEEVERNFAEGIKYLEMRGVSAITGDCGFMMAFQVLARKIAAKPVFMSSMVQCPVIAAAFDPQDLILILTANGDSLRSQKECLLRHCGFDVDANRFIIVGCQDVLGFDAVAKGEKVPLDIVQPGILKLVMGWLKRCPAISAILLECTELPPYADALRAATNLPVWDAITGADFYVSAFMDNPRFGINDWQEEWDGEQDDYSFGQNLIKTDYDKLVNKPGNASNSTARKKPSTKEVRSMVRKAKKKAHPTLGVIRLDYNYPPAKGDTDCPASYDYDVIYRTVPGFTFEMAQSGEMAPSVEQEFKLAVQWLEAQGVCGISGDCGFMMAFQPIARKIASVPVFLSAMVQCPMISVAFDKYDKVLILTANSMTLQPQKEALLSHCGFDVDDDRFVIYGCQDVPGFDAVAKGEKVDVDKVTPGIVSMANDIIRKIPSIRAICLECTELPPYADALRASTKLPVFDAITVTDFFVSARRDNPRFGFNNWQSDWDHTVDAYKLGDNLTKEQRDKALFV